MRAIVVLVLATVLLAVIHTTGEIDRRQEGAAALSKVFFFTRAHSEEPRGSKRRARVCRCAQG